MDFLQLEETYFVSLLARKKNAVFSMPAAQPSAQNGMERLLDTYMPLLKAAEPAAAAAYFSSWFGGVALAFHYFISRNKGPDLSLGNITVQLYPVGNYHRFSFQVGEWQEQDAPLDPKERDRWRERMFTDFFTAKPCGLYSKRHRAQREYI